ncbi:MAG: hypothetical protein SFY66_27435 [Oculatellaceae cyanobacterium bins.114]|nr:hypothetical protein [Oculatellaceae cyanobacterium bins.114]
METSEIPQPRKSVNIFKWIGIGCGGFFLLLLIGSIGLAIVVQRWLNLSADPQQAEQKAQTIMDYQIPGGAEGLMSVEVSGMTFAGVGSADGSGDIMLMLGKVPGNPNEFQDSFQKSFQESFQDQSGQNLNILSTRIEAKQLCGQDVSVTVLEGEQSTVNTRESALVYQTVVQHNQDLIVVYLTTIGDNAKATADQVFNSLNCK